MQQLIYNFPEEVLADAGIMAIEPANFDGIERLALVTIEQSTTVRFAACIQDAEVLSQALLPRLAQDVHAYPGDLSCCVPSSLHPFPACGAALWRQHVAP